MEKISFPFKLEIMGAKYNLRIEEDCSCLQEAPAGVECFEEAESDSDGSELGQHQRGVISAEATDVDVTGNKERKRSVQVDKLDGDVSLPGEQPELVDEGDVQGKIKGSLACDKGDIVTVTTFAVGPVEEGVFSGS
ncbi:hypothetical protein A2U01_0018303 [Trifolium medium]|uniref:Uncharacterized protein n=1 Tax=Trifolium medium TaxID=97028 RepID=A0A392NDN3_9FABA|nr:hypothetical protein [Trifolium medium]